MKTYFKIFVYTSILILCAFFFSHQANSDNTSSPNLNVEPFSSAYHLKSWYEIDLGNIPIGLLAVGVNKNSIPIVSDYSLQFVSRVGRSPFYTKFNGHTDSMPQNKMNLIQKLVSKSEFGTFQEFENRWEYANNQIQILENKGATLNAIFPNQFSKNNLPSTLTSQDSQYPHWNLFYYQVEKNNPKILFPFLGERVDIEKLKIKYDPDGFLNSASMPLAENIGLNFSRISENDYVDLIKSISQTRVDLGWLSSFQNSIGEINNLINNLNVCEVKIKTLNHMITRSIPQSSYLSYRKLINISHFCTETKKLLEKNKNKDFSLNMVSVSKSIKKLLSEDKLELPYAIINSPDLTLFYNDTVSFLWPRLISSIINNSIEEIDHDFDLEKNVKSLLGIQINISSMQTKSVVRADIKLIQPFITFTIEKNKKSIMMPDSLTAESLKLLDKQKSIYINGEYFAQNQILNFNQLCEKFNGRLGLDLGEAPQIIINTPKIRGIWDTTTRMNVAQEFALKAFSSKNCRQLLFKVPDALYGALKNELDNFNNYVISPDNSILLSNNIQKKILVMPGKYRMTTSSLISGSIISTHEFSIEPGTNSSVTAKAY